MILSASSIQLKNFI